MIGPDGFSGDEAAQEPRGKCGSDAAEAVEKGARTDARHLPEEVGVCIGLVQVTRLVRVEMLILVE